MDTVNHKLKPMFLLSCAPVPIHSLLLHHFAPDSSDKQKIHFFFDSSILPTGLLFNLPQRLLLIEEKLWNVMKLNCCRLSVVKCHYISEPQYL